MASTELIPNLANDCVMEILKTLPAVNLLRCKCVCRSWRRIIESPMFVRLHLDYTTSKLKPRDEVILLQLNPRGGCSGASEFYAIENRFPTFADAKLRRSRTLKYPVRPLKPPSSGGKFQIVGTCHGLLLLLVDNNNLDPSSSSSTRLVLWNPTTQKSRDINPPLPISESFINGNAVNGFGYDSAGSRDIKVVRVIPNAEFSQHEIMVFTLQTRSWKRMVAAFNKPYKLVMGQMPAAAAGVMFFLASNYPESGEYVVLRFCLASERFMEEILPAPPFDPPGFNHVFGAVFGVRSGVPCLQWTWIPHHQREEEFALLRFEVWLLKEEEEEESSGSGSGSWSRIFNRKSMFKVPRYVLGEKLIFYSGRSLFPHHVTPLPPHEPSSMPMELLIGSDDCDHLHFYLTSFIQTLLVV